MMSMMQNFFSIRKDSRHLFEGVKITEHKEFCQKWMNQYPVLFISFKDVEADHFHEAYDMLLYRLSEVCIELADIVTFDKADPEDKAVFARLKSKSAREYEVKNSLKTIMRILRIIRLSSGGEGEYIYRNQ